MDGRHRAWLRGSLLKIPGLSAFRGRQAYVIDGDGFCGEGEIQAEDSEWAIRRKLDFHVLPVAGICRSPGDGFGKFRLIWFGQPFDSALPCGAADTKVKGGAGKP